MAKKPLYLPVIERADFGAFQKIMGTNLNYSYERWLAWSAAWQMMNAECHIREVRVSPDAFEAYRVAHRRPPDLTTLLDFAASTPGSLGLGNQGRP